MYTQEDREAMIDLIEYYRDEHHRKDFGHNDMIANIPTADEETLETYNSILDIWLDNL